MDLEEILTEIDKHGKFEGIERYSQVHRAMQEAHESPDEMDDLRDEISELEDTRDRYEDIIDELKTGILRLKREIEEGEEIPSIPEALEAIITQTEKI